MAYGVSRWAATPPQWGLRRGAGTWTRPYSAPHPACFVGGRSAPPPDTPRRRGLAPDPKADAFPQRGWPAAHAPLRREREWPCQQGGSCPTASLPLAQGGQR